MKNNKVEKAFSSVARKVSERNVNEACMWLIHQPVIPEAVKQKLQKNK